VVHVGPDAGGTILVAWPGLTLPPPAAAGGCVTGAAYDPRSGTLNLNIRGGPGCEVTITAT
jgi:hypothetical protein